jgi:hypothetical protein
MSSLRELQQRFARGLLAHNAAAPGFADVTGSRGGEGMAVYRRTITSNYRNAMGATYPAVRRIVGAPFFHAAADAYAEKHPSRSGDLNEYGDGFAVFLESYPPAAELRYLPDVARLEWAMDEANRAAGSPSSPESVLGALSQRVADELPGLRLLVEPSCRVVSSAFPLLRIWQVNQPDYHGDLRVDFTTGPESLRIRREPGGTDSGSIVVERLDPGDLCWLSALQDGATLAEAIERAVRAGADFDLQRALRRFIGDGSIAGIRDSKAAELGERL